MSGRSVSRRKIAQFVAEALQAGKGDTALKQAAAYLVETGQTRSAGLLVRDIEEELAKSGTIVADITSARPLSASDKAAVAKLLGAQELQVREIIDPSVLGGMRIEAAGQRLDATLKAKIDSLKETGLRKGTA